MGDRDQVIVGVVIFAQAPQIAEREVYGDHKNLHYLGVTSLRFLARAT